MKKTTLKTLALVCTGLFVTACSSGSDEMPSAAATNTSSTNSAQNAANSNTSANTNTATNSNTSTNTNTATNSNTSTNTNTATNSNTSTNTNTATNSNTSTNTNTATNSNTSANNQSATSTAAGDGGVQISSNQGSVVGAPFTDANGDTNGIIIDGVKVSLNNNKMAATGNRLTETTNNINFDSLVSGKYLSYMRFGTTWSYSASYVTGVQETVYAVGSKTAATDMPTSGKASYKGIALASSLGTTTPAGVMTTSSFDVDFGRKTISGQAANIPLAATISGNSFQGTKDGVEMKGYFFGPQAAEMGGVFKGESITDSGVQQYVGAFGAKKQ